MPRKKCPHHFDSYQPTSIGPFSWQCEYGHCPLVIPKITCADLCRPIHAIINYSTFIFPFESGNCVKEGKKLQKKKKYLENKKSFFFVVIEVLSCEKNI